MWSGRADLNGRPLAPQASALPGCATPRHHSRLFKKATSGVLGPLPCSRTEPYAPRAKGPAALLDDLFEQPAQ